MPGSVIVPAKTIEETLIYVMLGLWDDGFRKIILVNNHGHHWMLESAIQEFFKRFQLPAFVTLVDWHRVVREFFYARPDKDNTVSSQFVHADESETSIGLLLFPEMLDMNSAVDTEPDSIMLQGHYDTACDSYRRPHSWVEAQGHSAMEIFGTPEGVVGYPSRATAEKAKRPIAAICSYLVLMIDQILQALPPGQVPPLNKITMRTAEELAPCLKEPLSPGWMSVHGLKKIGVFND
jgi:creatinine amidohydrolase